MTIVYVLVIVGLILAFVAWLLLRIFKRASEEVNQRWEADAKLVESAPWFGKTGLAASDERELSRYLRREFGEVGDDGALRAVDLVYLGIQTDERGSAHFWRIPKRDREDTYSYAYIDIDEQGRATCYGWGDRDSPSDEPAR
jgi:hypothetical protein